MAARLYKIEQKSLSDKAMDWMLRHPTITLIIIGIILALLIGTVFNIIYGMCTIESGVMRNYMNNSL
jgi:hypothetical protein